MPGMTRAFLLLMLTLALVLSGSAAVAKPTGGTPVALVTAETENQLIAVSFPDGRVLRRVPLPGDPQNVAANQHVVVVVSPRSGAVSLLGAHSLRVTKVLRGFASPHMATLAPVSCPDGRPPCRSKWVYVTDDGRGLLDVISLQQKRVVARLEVGLGAHHMALSPNGRRLWIALGEQARTLVIVDVSRPEHPRVISRFDPGFLAHDLAFSPSGRKVWVTSAKGSSVAVLDARRGRRLLSVPAGPPPQHVVFGPGRPHRAYVTSGYGSRIESVDSASGRVLRIARVPYASFNLAPAGDLIVTPSLSSGTVTELDVRLHVWRSVKVAPATRGVATVVWP
jgi:DNA-binding beta-propeller fold protein YncE